MKYVYCRCMLGIPIAVSIPVEVMQHRAYSLIDNLKAVCVCVYPTHIRSLSACCPPPSPPPIFKVSLNSLNYEW